MDKSRGGMLPPPPPPPHYIKNAMIPGLPELRKSAVQVNCSHISLLQSFPPSLNWSAVKINAAILIFKIYHLLEKSFVF